MLGLPQPKENVPWNMNIEKYSINLMWINKKLIKGQTYIDNSKTISELKKKLLDPALKWAKANPNAAVNIWYDGVHTEEEAIKHTQDALLSMNTKEFSGITIRLRDIREIPIVRDNLDVFSDFLPLYFRIDLLKAIIIVDAIERECNDAAIFSDLEVGDLRPNGDRMNKEELFSPLTEVSARFAKSGLILNKNSGYIENQFIQLYNNPKMIFAIKHAVINVNLTRAISALNFKCEAQLMQEDYVQSLARAVYPSIQQDVFAYYEAITNPEYQLLVRPDIVGKGTRHDTWLPYNPNEHGYTAFGLQCFFRTRGAIIFQDGEYISVSTVFNLPKIDFCSGAGRKVDVRRGKDHYDFPTDLPDAERIPKPPVSNDGVYRCKLWESPWVFSTQLNGAKESSVIDAADMLLILKHCDMILNNIIPSIKESKSRDLVLEYLSESDTIYKQYKQSVLNNSSFLTAKDKLPVIFSFAPQNAAFIATTTPTVPPTLGPL